MDHVVFSTERDTHPYHAPAIRVVTSLIEQDNFLASNTERIEDDGQEHGWD